MQPNIDHAAREKRRKEALRSAVIATVTRILLAPLLIWLGVRNHADSLLAWVFLGIGIVNLGMIIPIWKSYQIRLQEIEGGEEDAAAQY